jgi:hypothetical protein
MQANYADDVAVNDGDQNVVNLSAFVEKFTNRFEAAVRELQRVTGGLRRRVTLPDASASAGSALRMVMFIFSRTASCSVGVSRVPIYFSRHIHHNRQNNE